MGSWVQAVIVNIEANSSQSDGEGARVKKPAPPLKRYHPANGSEGEIFMDAFCHQCIRHPISSDARHQCEILLASFVCTGVNDSKHPAQWQYQDGSPVCTAFKSRSQEYKRRAANRKKGGSRLIPAANMPDLFGDQGK